MDGFTNLFRTAMLLFKCLNQSSEAEHYSQAKSLTSGIQKIQVFLKLYMTANLIPLFGLYFFYCICLTLSLIVNDNNYFFCGFLVESLKLVFSSWYGLHISNYIKVIKENSVPFCQTHAFISLLIKSKPNGKTKMDQDLPFLFKFYLY